MKHTKTNRCKNGMTLGEMMCALIIAVVVSFGISKSNAASRYNSSTSKYGVTVIQLAMEKGRTATR